MQLTKNHDAGYGLQVWTPNNPRNQVAPILTPAYPSMNSTLAMSRNTLQIMQLEFSRGANIISKLWDQHKSDPKADLNWKELLRPSDFFIEYPLYLSLCMVGPSQSEAQAWVGFVESRLRVLVADILGRSLPLSKIQLWPKKLGYCIADRSSLLSHAQRANSVTYMIGFQVDKLRMRGNELNVELQMKRFRDKDLSRYSDFVEGMDVLTKCFKCKNLPTVCFEFYEGGKPAAMQRRRMLRDADPTRQERRNKRKLAEMNKARMELEARVQKMKKRKTGPGMTDVAVDDGNTDVDNAHLEPEPNAGESKKIESKSENTASQQHNGGQEEEEEEENALLESALNVAGEGGEGERKTQEEAEADRKKLLSGELLAEGAEDIADNDLGYYDVESARQNIVMKSADNTKIPTQDIRALPMQEEEAELLRKAGYTVVSDAEKETKIIGGNQPTPFRSRVNDSAEVSEEGQANATFEIKFKTKWEGLVELDIAGHVIDKGDEDFKPSKAWTGRMAGFEFKLGERGLGYYRTGKPVAVPSNTAY
jgi:Poly(A) polymerase central domain/Poly(A) polymerase predicted RNA binding domain